MTSIYSIPLYYCQEQLDHHLHQHYDFEPVGRQQSRRTGSYEMFEFSKFSNVLVVPYTELLGIRSYAPLHRGGPIWPDWELRTFERHRHTNRMFDDEPVGLEPVRHDQSGNAFWGGPVCGHIGHQIADFSMRLLASRIVDPNARLIFATKAKFLPRAWFEGILDWFEIAAENCQLVREPTEFLELSVVAQQETIPWGGPSGEYLDHLDRLVEKKRLQPLFQGLVIYVSRGGQRARFAGETYLESAIHAAGGVVFRPELHPLPEQVSAYIGASRLIFAEGSALHVCQLAGRQFASIDVLTRRENSKMAAASLRPRARNLRYIDALRGNVHGLNPRGDPARGSGLAILHEGRIMDYFASISLDLKPHWDHAEFERVMQKDIQAWLSQELASPRVKIPNFMDKVMETAASAGLEHLHLDSAS